VKLQFKKRRLLPAALAIVVLVVGSGVAYAYWTSTGGGSGSADTGTNVALTATATTTVPLVPGGTVSVTIVVTNPASFSQSFTAVAIAVTPDGADATDASGLTGCKISWFSTTSAGGAVIAPSPATATVTGTLTMTDAAVSQDACKGKTIPLTLTVS
jgi:hypothetical protein